MKIFQSVFEYDLLECQDFQKPEFLRLGKSKNRRKAKLKKIVSTSEILREFFLLNLN